LPKKGFLEGVQSLAKKHGAVFVFDETITGFRFANGGAQEYFGITPDLACFGKGLANGYPLSAVVGKKDIMMRMEDIFFSGTFGGETVSLAAANAVLNKLKKEPVIPHLWSLGKHLHDGLDNLIDEYGFNKIFNVSGCSVWSFFNIKDTSFASAYELKTLLLQEMFEQEILNLGVHNISYAHTKNMVQKLINGYEVFFTKVQECRRNGIDSLLKCKSLEPLFKVR
jgi:glutamate-1-semialdehyde 2,1-aminomutase